MQTNVCCIFQPAFGCCTNKMLVEIYNKCLFYQGQKRVLPKCPKSNFFSLQFILNQIKMNKKICLDLAIINLTIVQSNIKKTFLGCLGCSLFLKTPTFCFPHKKCSYAVGTRFFQQSLSSVKLITAIQLVQHQLAPIKFPCSNQNKLISIIFRRFSIRSLDNLGLIIPNNKTIEIVIVRIHLKRVSSP